MRVEDALVALGVAYPENASRARHLDAARRERFAQSTAATRLSFLQVELQTGNTLLDAADTTKLESTRVRRRARAQEAHDVVAGYLSGETELGLTAAQRAELDVGLAQLRARLDAA